MKAKLVRFGEIMIAGQSFTHDVVISAGKVSRRKKKASRPYQAQFGHTPLSADEYLPWDGEKLIIGTGHYGRLPVMPQVFAEGKKRGVDIIAVPTAEACKMLSNQEPETVNAILHVTC